MCGKIQWPRMMWRLSYTVLVQVFKLFLVDVSGRHQSFLHPQQLGWLDSLHHYNTYWYPKQSEHIPYRTKLFKLELMFAKFETAKNLRKFEPTKTNSNSWSLPENITEE